MKTAMWAWLGRFVYRVGGVVALPLLLNGTRRTRVALIDQETNEILLAKVWIGAQNWGLPGGGIDRDEDMLVSAIREVKEETGLDYDQHELIYIGDHENKTYLAKYTTHIFIAPTTKFEAKKPPIELLDLQWFKLSKLPINHDEKTIKLVKNKLATSGRQETV